MNAVSGGSLFLSCLLLAACSNGGGSSSGTSTSDAASPTATQGFKLKSGDWGDDDYGKIAERFGTNYQYGQNAQGQQSGKFNRENPEFKGRWQNKEFNAQAYQKKSFWGDREYAKKVYAGNTDGSRFAKTSRFDGKGAREAGTAAHDAGKTYATNNYKTSAAREAGGKEIARTPDAETDIRRRVYSQPEIVDWKDQRALTIEETRRMLGRD